MNMNNNINILYVIHVPMMPLSLSEESFDILFHFLFLLSSIPC